MIDYEKLLNELNQFAMYILNSLKTKYGHFFSDKKEHLLFQMVQDENLVVIDSLAGDNKIHINPNHKIFQTENYDVIKKYFEENVLVNEILRSFITLPFSESETVNLPQANLHQKFRLFLRNALINYISQELCFSNRLVPPEARYSDYMEFINALDEASINFGSLKCWAFSDSYLFFCEKFFEQTGEDILEFYQNFLDKKVNIQAIEVLDETENCLASRR